MPQFRTSVEQRVNSWTVFVRAKTLHRDSKEIIDILDPQIAAEKFILKVHYRDWKNNVPEIGKSVTALALSNTAQSGKPAHEGGPPHEPPRSPSRVTPGPPSWGVFTLLSNITPKWKKIENSLKHGHNLSLTCSLFTHQNSEKFISAFSRIRNLKHDVKPIMRRPSHFSAIWHQNEKTENLFQCGH